ncbi:MAG TPA: hypothetical protein VGE98_04690, partial [Thermoanaerobaculia bacterium]
AVPPPPAAPRPEAREQPAVPRREPPQTAPAGEPPQPPVPPRASAAPAGEAAWRATVLEEINKRRPPLAALLADAQLDRAEDRLSITPPPGDSWLAGRLQQPSNRQVLDEVVPQLLGAGVSWRVAEPAAAPPDSRPAAALVAANADVVENPTVQTILDIFGGTVERVEESGSLREDLT